ncbi:hypothetical protein [Candidatus Chloroploca sp. Khr17]|uniref:hypothetical protein n=1 Tax=Candidatus Chloroploca sp. Khr17 TaxID=2496869 RepID=UPI00101DFD47|nr:hypothetical protein [Candidatus Chloroploca sp. Khr17]
MLRPQRFHVLIAFGLMVVLAFGFWPQAQPPVARAQVFATTITVDSTTDPDLSMSATCVTASPCTLRRAIVQARASTTPRPVLINFNLPANEANTGDAAGTWTIVLSEGVGANLRDLAGGQVTIDGSTQPGGRAVGPRVFLRGSTQADRFVINGNENRLIGLGFQYYSVIFNGSDNGVSDVWSGLRESGQEIFFVRGDPTVDSRASFEDATASTGNTYNRLIVTGSRTVAISMRGSNGTIEGSLFGTRADGTVPTIAADRKCRPNARYNNWFGGAGIALFGSGHVVRDNRFVGLLWASNDPLNTPPTAIDIDKGGNLIENNIIGIDAAVQKFGTCGDAIRLTNQGNVIRGNTIYGAGTRNDDVNKITEGEQPQTGAIGLSGSGVSLGSNLIRSNVVEDSIAPVFFFPSVTVNYSYFNPAKVTSIVGRTVSGTSGDPGVPPPPAQPVDSTCPNCVIELFLDNRDGNIETLEALGTVTADAQGNWTAPDILPPGGLGSNQGLRTQSTTTAEGTIQGFGAGTSTRVSRNLYGPDGVIATPPPPVRPDADAPTEFTPVQARPVPPLPTYTFVTTITVNSTADPDTSSSTKCATNPCTLRRAIVQARDLPANERPVLINFNIPTTDPGYNAALEVWRIDLNSAASNVFRRLEGGQIVIDGTTQPGGRATGPKIFVRGTNTQQILIVDSRDNIIRGLGLQGFGLQVNLGGNFIEANWLGLNEDGQSIYYIGGNNTIDNKATIQDAETPPAQEGGNVYRNNVVTGSRVSGMTIRSDDSWVVGNYLGTRPDGTIPAPPEGETICTDPNWIAGQGLSLLGGLGTQAGGPTEAERNYIVGLSIRSNDPASTQPFGIQIGSVGNYLVQNNYIGRDTAGNDVGVCGEGIRMSGNFSVLRENYIVTPQNAALNHLPDVVGANANTYQGNLIVTSQRPIIFGPIVPNDLAYFNPGKITSIDDTLVRGTSGDPGIPPGGAPPVDSTCPFCTIEVFLDNDDSLVETLESFGTTMADANGNWTFTLPRALEEGERLRTMSTTNNYGVINQYEAGTSTKVSELYPLNTNRVFLPVALR